MAKSLRGSTRDMALDSRVILSLIRSCVTFHFARSLSLLVKSSHTGANENYITNIKNVGAFYIYIERLISYLCVENGSMLLYSIAHGHSSQKSRILRT